jgi:hypothetical protein
LQKGSFYPYAHDFSHFDANKPATLPITDFEGPVCASLDADFAAHV